METSSVSLGNLTHGGEARAGASWMGDSREEVEDEQWRIAEGRRTMGEVTDDRPNTRVTVIALDQDCWRPEVDYYVLADPIQ